MKIRFRLYLWCAITLLCACGGGGGDSSPSLPTPPKPITLNFVNSTPVVAAQSVNSISVKVASTISNTEVAYIVLVAGSAAPSRDSYFSSGTIIGRFQFTIATKNTIEVDTHNEQLTAETAYDVYVAIKKGEEILIHAAKLSVTTLAAPGLKSYPVDPNKRAVEGVDLSGIKHPFTLAYDQTDASTIYYDIRAARVADLNGQARLGYINTAAGGTLNAQLSFGASQADVAVLKNRIRDAGLVPAVFPVTSTTIRPVVPGLDRDTGTEVCAVLPDPSTGMPVQVCESSIIDAELLSRTHRPTLTEDFALAYNVNPFGAKIYSRFLSKGYPIQFNIEVAYIKAGEIFTAEIDVDYDKLLKNYIAFYAVCDNYCSDNQVELFFKKEGLCVDRSKADCGISPSVKDGAGNVIPPTILPTGMTEQALFQAVDNPLLENPSGELFNAIITWQSVERLMQRLDGKMFILTGQKKFELSIEPTYTNKLNTDWAETVKGTTQKFSFKSPNGLNRGLLVIPSGLACVVVANNVVTRVTTGDCAGYWNGVVSFGDILDTQF